MLLMWKKKANVEQGNRQKKSQIKQQVRHPRTWHTGRIRSGVEWATVIEAGIR